MIHQAEGCRFDCLCTCKKVTCKACHKLTCYGATIDGLCLKCWDKKTGWTDPRAR